MFTDSIPALSEDLKRVYIEMGKLAASDRRNDLAGEILDAVTETTGKGYRPSILLLTARLGDRFEERREHLCRLAALVEYVHMASLVHDDIIDDSLMRRGAPTIQARFGKDMAVFTGDLMLGQVMKVLLQEDYKDSGLMIAQTVRDMCAGEISQADCLFDCDTGVDQYYKNIYGKTASIFITACRIGALESGCDESVVDLAGRLGEHLGYLFQIRDDLLDFTADAGGKPVRQDFSEGIMTLPVLYAMRDPYCRDGLKQLASKAKKTGLTDAELEELDILITDGGGFEETIKDAEQHRQKACDILDMLTPCETSGLLRKLLDSLTLPEFPKDGKRERNIA